MKKSLLTTIVLFSTLNTFAAQTKGGSDIGSGTDKTLSCYGGMLTATAKPEDSKLLGQGNIIELKKTDDETYEGEFVVTSSTGQKAELYLMAADYPENKLTSMDMSLTIDNKRVLMDSFLMKSDGLSDGAGWDLGPANAEQFKMLFANSLSEKAIDANITKSASDILTKYGYAQRQEDADLNRLYEAVVKAVKNGELKEGEIIGTLVTFGCFKK